MDAYGFGVSVVRPCTEQVFFSAYGTGANGKSTLYETIIDLLGDYAGTMQFETVLAGDKSNTRTLKQLASFKVSAWLLPQKLIATRELSEAK